MEQRADILFTGGHVWTGIERRAPLDSVAIRDGRIVGVGMAHDLGWALGPRTRRIPLAGRLLVPGFSDSHVHPLLAGLGRDRCMLTDLPDVSAYLEAIDLYATRHPERPWILGEGWSQGAFPGGLARASQLDEVVAERPVLLYSRDGHSAWVNSLALARAGITRDTLDPPRGRIERHGDGAPMGTLHEAATALVERHAPVAPPAELEAALRWGQGELHRLGVTGWHDADVTVEQQAAYLALEARGELTGRVALALRWVPDRGMEQVSELVARREAIRSDGAGRVRAVSVKLFQDGVVENATAALLEPYQDGRGRAPRDRGPSVYSAKQLRDICVALDRERFAVHAHAIGDRAVREVLDALTVARKTNGPRAPRHSIAHLQLVHPTDLPRFRALGVVANCQPFWAYPDDDVRGLDRTLLGADRVARMYPFGSLQRVGTTLAIGSDWNVTTADPLQLLEVAVRRIDPAHRSARPLGPASERLTPEAALRAATRGSAYVNWSDDESGTIELGKAADLVLLDRDPLAAGGGPFGDARVLLTLIDGRPVWAHPDLAA